MSYQIKYSEKKFKHKEDFAIFLKENKEAFYKLKKNEIKDNTNKVIDSYVSKAFNHITPKITAKTDHIEVISVINTTNLIDSHLDLHLPNLWKKNLKENPEKLQLQEHQMKFDNLLDAKAKAYVQTYKFSELGLESEMETQALLHKFNFKKSRNEKMLYNYIDGVVKEHSVGMLYVKLSFAYNDPEDEKEYNFFNENKSLAVNPEVADEMQYFWVVSEAKDIEGSGVVKGSNFVTPTLIVRDYEPSKDTQKEIEPLLNTQELIKEMFNF